jgi:hypothetical protein
MNFQGEQLEHVLNSKYLRAVVNADGKLTAEVEPIVATID